MQFTCASQCACDFKTQKDTNSIVAKTVTVKDQMYLLGEDVVVTMGDLVPFQTFLVLLCVADVTSIAQTVVSDIIVIIRL